MALAVSIHGARALELDNLLPAGVPGYGDAPGVSILSRVHPQYTPFDIEYGTLSLSPRVNAAAGYDSNPNGQAPASGAFSLAPGVLAQDTQIGFGAYLAGIFSTYPQAATQNSSAYTVALGETALLPRETLTLSMALAGAPETGFGFNTAQYSKPVMASVKDLRGSDKLVLGMLTLTPKLAVSQYDFADSQGQNRTDYRQSVTGDFSSGAPLRIVSVLQATESLYGYRSYDANSFGALAGFADEAAGIWQIRMLAGIATRRPATGKGLDAPILEASLSWMPGELDSFSISLAREIDDPDQESADGYTLSQAEFSFAHEYLRNVIFTGSARIGQAKYFSSPLNETLLNVQSALDWHLNRALAVNASYAFNDRQANFLPAANEHIITMGVTWTP